MHPNPSRAPAEAAANRRNLLGLAKLGLDPMFIAAELRPQLFINFAGHSVTDKLLDIIAEYNSSRNAQSGCYFLNARAVAPTYYLSSVKASK